MLAGATQLVSARNPAVPLSVPGNGNSAGPILTPDGRYVVFISTANDLTPGGNNRLVGNVFLRDRQLNTTILISTNINGTGGGNGQPLADAISTDGRYVLFESDASDLVPGDTNGVADVFVRDVILGTTTLVSVSTNGGPANGPSSKPVMTPDGRFVAFISSATNLVANDTNGIADIFVRDLLSGTTTLVTPGATIYNGNFTNLMNTLVITPDGRFVAYSSSAKNLVPGMNYFPSDVFVRDLLAGTTTWVSTNHYSFNYPSAHPVVSDDGRYIAFKQYNNSSGSYVYRYDTLAATTTEINTNTNGVSLVNGVYASLEDVQGPEMTSDGRYVFYVGSSNTTPAAIYVWDSQVQSNTPVSLNISGVIPTNTTSQTPVIGSSAHYLTFMSTATNLVTNTVSNGFHIYLRDIQLGTNYLVDVDTNGVGSTDINGTVQTMSADGRYVAFASLDAGFVAGDNNQGLDVFVRDTTNGTTELVSKRDTGVIPQSGGSISSMSQVSITPDGRWLVFSSRSDDLVPNDSNNEQDVFVRDLLNGTNILVSVGTNGSAALGGWSGYPAISADGRYVAFVSAATNLAVAGAYHAAAAYFRDLQAGTTTFLKPSLFDDPPLGDGDVSPPSISSDGRFIAFLAKTNGPATVTNSFWFDVVSNRIVMLTNVNSTLPPSISTNGRYVAFANNFSQLYVRDMQTGTNILFSNNFNAGGMAISPGGTKLLYSVPQNIQHLTGVVDLGTGSNLFSMTRTLPVRSAAQWSGDDRFFAFVANTNLTVGDNNNTNDVYLCDLQTGTVTLVSLNSAHTGTANGPSDFPAVSGNGRFLVYRSFATDIVPGVTNPPNLFVFDRFTGSNSLITVETAPASFWSPWVSQPAISSDGSAVAFQSFRPNLGLAMDLNRNQDVFSQAQSPLSFVDSDGDGIPDWWMMQYFGHPTGQAGDLSRAQDDADGDGMSNLQEYLTGTNPKDPNSVFKLQITPVIASPNVTLTWPSVPGKSYRVQFKNLLTDAQWSDVGSNIFVGGAQVSFSVPGNLPSRYFRVLAVN